MIVSNKLFENTITFKRRKVTSQSDFKITSRRRIVYSLLSGSGDRASKLKHSEVESQSISQYTWRHWNYRCGRCVAMPADEMEQTETDQNESRYETMSGVVAWRVRVRARRV